MERNKVEVDKVEVDKNGFITLLKEMKNYVLLESDETARKEQREKKEKILKTIDSTMCYHSLKGYARDYLEAYELCVRNHNLKMARRLNRWYRILDKEAEFVARENQEYII